MYKNKTSFSFIPFHAFFFSLSWAVPLFLLHFLISFSFYSLPPFFYTLAFFVLSSSIIKFSLFLPLSPVLSNLFHSLPFPFPSLFILFQLCLCLYSTLFCFFFFLVKPLFSIFIYSFFCFSFCQSLCHSSFHLFLSFLHLIIFTSSLSVSLSFLISPLLCFYSVIIPFSHIPLSFSSFSIFTLSIEPFPYLLFISLFCNSFIPFSFPHTFSLFSLFYTSLFVFLILFSLITLYFSIFLGLY